MKRSSMNVMMRLLKLVKPLTGTMILAVTMGVAGHLCAIGIPVLGAMALTGTSLKTVVFVLPVIAIARGVFHLLEQNRNHYLAFTLLALIRDKVFGALRKLAPAKLEGRDKGNLIAILTADIELLEVFYAHTISPIAIALLTSLIMVVFIGHYHILAGLLALVAYIIVGVVIPIINGKLGSEEGMAFRTRFGELNSFVLDSLRGLDETIQYGQGEERKKELVRRSQELADQQEYLSFREGAQRSITNMVILLASFGMLFLTLSLYLNHQLGFEGIITCTLSMTGSFGPVVALSSLSNNLNQTLASGERVLSLLEEQPLVEEVEGDQEMSDSFKGAQIDHVTFSYDDKTILDDYSLKLEPGKITGIHGVSGSGKSTLLKLLMRFWDVNQGAITVDEEDIKQIPTKHLRDMESYVTQETHLFHDSIANNIAIAKPKATREEIMEAAKKASIHDFIMTLPKGYDTEVGELGDTLSGGEKQRIGIARAFLHDAPMILMDEPTSNLDSLNEGIILKSLKESSEEKTIVLVSHRVSTMNIADTVYEMKDGRIS